MENFIISLSFLIIGMALKRIPNIPQETGNVLNTFVIYVSLPALVLVKMPELAFAKSLLVPALMPWAMLLLSAALIVLLGKLLNWERGIIGCLLLLVPLGNTSFLGIPMVRAFFGETAIPYALIYDQLGSFLALATYGSLILALYGTVESKTTSRQVVIKVVSFPPFFALVVALLLKSIPYPQIALNLLNTLAGTLVPLVMIAVGFQLKLRLSRETTAPLIIGLFFKLVAAPAAALFLCHIFGLKGEAAQVAIFEAGMPPMVSGGALAILANLSPPLSAALVGIGIVLSFATLPVLYHLL